MTEEIIIDGVNVAGCKYYLFRDKEPTSDRTCGIGLVACVGKECDYKIILRLKQENEKLKKEVKYWQSDVINDIKQYRSALEEIREIAEKYKDMEGCRIPLGAIKMTVDKVLNLS